MSRVLKVEEEFARWLKQQVELCRTREWHIQRSWCRKGLSMIIWQGPVISRALEMVQRSWCPLSATRLDRFEKTNEMLLNFNNLSSARLQQMTERFLHHTRTLVEMKRDLDSIFRRIRTLKGKLARQHPEAFSHIPEASLLEDEDEDHIPPSTTTTIATSEQSTGSCDTSPDTVSPSLSPGFEDLSHVRPGSPAINGRSQTDDEEMLGE